MTTSKSIQSIADDRIREAECLYDNGHFDLAFYVAGYAVELYLKARICVVLNIPDFFDFGNRKKFENEDNITKPYKVHNFDQLLILSGLSLEHNKMLQMANFKKDWSALSQWREDVRYSKGKKQQDVGIFISGIKNYTVWIKQFL